MPPSPSGSASAERVKPRSRVRLPPEVRIQQILDQALVEFAQHGFEAARMDNIAQRCGMSKGGLYAHFVSKDALFEALLTRSLAPVDLQQMDLPRPVPVRRLVTWIVNQMYASLTHPQTVATMRLLIAEGSRVPDLVKLWGQRMVEPHLAMMSQMLSESSPGNNGKVSIVVREPWLVMSPAMHALTTHLILGSHEHVDLDQFKRGHIELLCELLEPVAPSGEVKKLKPASESVK